METQVIGRISGTGITTIWKSNSFSKKNIEENIVDILNENKYYAEIKPYTREETAFLYSHKYKFIVASNMFSQTATESRSHAVNYFIYMNEKELEHFQHCVPINFESAQNLGDESEAEKCGIEGFLKNKSEKVIDVFEEENLLIELMSHIVNGISVNIRCEKEREKSLFSKLISIFPNKEIGLNVSLDTSIDIAVNSKISDCMELKYGKKSSDNILSEKLTEEDILFMQETLMNVYLSCNEIEVREKTFASIQQRYKKELSKMINMQVVKPVRDKKYMALALLVCFKLSPYQSYLLNREKKQYLPICIYKSEIQTFLEENHVGKFVTIGIWKEIENVIMMSVIGE